MLAPLHWGLQEDPPNSAVNMLHDVYALIGPTLFILELGTNICIALRTPSRGGQQAAGGGWRPVGGLRPAASDG